MQLHKGASPGSLSFFSLDTLPSGRRLGKTQDGALIPTNLHSQPRETNPGQEQRTLSIMAIRLLIRGGDLFSPSVLGTLPGLLLSQTDGCTFVMDAVVIA